MKRRRRHTPVPISVSVFLLVIGLLLGTVFTVVFQSRNAPVDRWDAIAVDATFESYSIRGVVDERDQVIWLRFSDYENLAIDSSCNTADVRDKLERINEGDTVHLLLHPVSDTILEMRWRGITVLDFDTAQNHLRMSEKGFLALGIFMYFCAVVGVVTLLREVRRKKKGKGKRRA